MITIVYWEELESEYSDDAAEMAAVDGDSEILTVSESIETALDKIKYHQEATEGRDIQYLLSFWLDGEILCNAAIAENTSVDICREQIKEHVKSFLH
ncbi:hypothetical protein GuL6_113 [Buttiauxella phage vB_ButM_GuL6]|nr:hypothetical protein GuL6_113 [Buttiauxella phage vB_ButM_GuL6]